MQLSKHFTLKEMTKSMTAQRKGIDNTPGSAEIKNLGDLCYEVLEPLRAHFDKPNQTHPCLLYTSPSPRDRQKTRMPSSA